MSHYRRDFLFLNWEKKLHKKFSEVPTVNDRHNRQGSDEMIMMNSPKTFSTSRYFTTKAYRTDPGKYRVMNDVPNLADPENPVARDREPTERENQNLRERCLDPRTHSEVQPVFVWTQGDCKCPS